MSRYSLLVAFVILVAPAAQAIESWVERRDEGVVKQSLDYSCGAASLATMLTYELGRSTSEQEVLELWLENVQEAGGRDEGLLYQGLSYAEMNQVVERLGFAAGGGGDSTRAGACFKAPRDYLFRGFWPTPF